MKEVGKNKKWESLIKKTLLVSPQLPKGVVMNFGTNVQQIKEMFLLNIGPLGALYLCRLTGRYPQSVCLLV
jgi:hypothetical protein